MRAALGNRYRADKPPVPFIWHMARHCLDLPSSKILHFPAGTYNEQMASEWGQVELNLMEVAYTAWHMFGHAKLMDWSEHEREFATWMMTDGE